MCVCEFFIVIDSIFYHLELELHYLRCFDLIMSCRKFDTFFLNQTLPKTAHANDLAPYSAINIRMTYITRDIYNDRVIILTYYDIDI